VTLGRCANTMGKARSVMTPQYPDEGSAPRATGWLLKPFKRMVEHLSDGGECGHG
jgi:hypothetical protein